MYLALNKLNRFDSSYWRGAAMCVHHLREYGMAHGYYGMALAARDAQERVYLERAHDLQRRLMDLGA